MLTENNQVNNFEFIIKFFNSNRERYVAELLVQRYFVKNSNEKRKKAELGIR